MTQAFNLSQLANFVNSSGQLNATTGIYNLPSAAAFPSGTVMLFAQTSAPTGWTKQTDLNNYALRVTSGTAGTGGSVAFTTAFSSGLSSGATTLSTSQIPSHTHAVYVGGGDCPPAGTTGSIFNNYTSLSTGATGGGGSHTHTMPSLAVQYVDVIRATAN